MAFKVLLTLQTQSNQMLSFLEMWHFTAAEVGGRKLVEWENLLPSILE